MNILLFLFTGVPLLLGSVFLILGLACRDALFTWIGGFFLAAGLLVLILFLRGRTRKKLLKKNGRKVWALITKAKPDKEPLESGNYYVSLTCEAEGRSFAFSAVCADPENLPGKTVPVYISRTDPSKYLIDENEIR